MFRIFLNIVRCMDGTIVRDKVATLGLRTHLFTAVSFVTLLLFYFRWTLMTNELMICVKRSRQRWVQHLSYA